MTDASPDATDEARSRGRWSLLGLGGTVSLCCLVAAPATTGAVGTAVAGGTTAALGGGLVRVLVSAVTVGIIGMALQMWTSSPSCKR
ncbi:hypothetical protein ACFR9U_20555 [Halorientalis brevis]|uniref:Uncharacterized protein n=1 Tax=Halorientalis brevis TaxID=1126241 RepID=A0ABD6CH39_9EURY|nr:hypothetical protein [Halorientalis brevis]